MAHGNSNWDSILARIYYMLGAAYYFVHWIGLLGIASLITSLISILTQRVAVAVVLFAIGAILVGAAAGLAIISPRRRLRGANPRLRIHSIEEIYTIIRNNRFDSTRELKVQALGDGIDSYIDKFIWSGSGNIIPRIDRPAGAQANVEDEPLGYRKILRVRFPRPLRRNETMVLRYTLELEDTAQSARPFLGVGMTEWKVGTLTLRVIWKANIPAEYKRQMFLSNTSDIPVFEEVIPLNRTCREAIWVIQRPRAHWEFRIVW
jgi:hypothetical protein